MPPPTIRLGAFQFKGSSEIPDNLDAILRGMREAHKQKLRLLVLQECALTGYAGVDRDSPKTINPGMLRRATRTVALKAKEYGMHVALGTTVFDDEIAYNAVRLYGPDGKTHALYYKRAMYGADTNHYTPGTRHGICHVGNHRIGLRICYEFRFPEYFRQLLRRNASLAALSFSMVGPDDRKMALARSILACRAAENGIFIVAANNINGVQNAPTCILNPEGQFLETAPPDEECLISANIRLDPPTGLREAIVRHAHELNKGKTGS